MVDKKIIGYVGVDSGQVMVCDPCYINSQWIENKNSDWDKDLKDPKKKGEFSYEGCVQATLSKEQSGQLNYKLGHAGAGVVTSTFDGDGSYPVWAYFKDGRIRKIEVVFD